MKTILGALFRVLLFILLQCISIGAIACVVIVVPTLLFYHSPTRLDEIGAMSALVAYNSIGFSFIPTALGAVVCVGLGFFVHGRRYLVTSALIGSVAAIGAFYAISYLAICFTKDISVIGRFVSSWRCIQPATSFAVALPSIAVWTAIARWLGRRDKRSKLGSYA